jgi:hypothetical protein
MILTPAYICTNRRLTETEVSVRTVPKALPIPLLGLSTEFAAACLAPKVNFSLLVESSFELRRSRQHGSWELFEAATKTPENAVSSKTSLVVLVRDGHQPRQVDVKRHYSLLGFK